MSAVTNKVENFKGESDYLRGTIGQELHSGENHFGEASKQLLKFHGLYQQDDRDQRDGARRPEKEYSFMIRSKIPGGRLTAEQYLVHDELAGRYGNGTLRITTREDFQLHGVLKGELKQTLAAMNETLITTLGACGDLVRNVMCCPVPPGEPLRAELYACARRISDHLRPHTRAYHEIWLDGEKVSSGETGEEPIYGQNYLPRKFKIAIAYPGDNCVDVYTQDVGLVPVVQGGALQGYNLLVGGGLGMTHNKPETFPRLADALAFVLPAEVVPAVEAVVTIHRDHGDRGNRKHARLKYLVHDWGIERFRAEVERRLGYRLSPVVPTPPFELELHLGWHEQGDGCVYLGLSVENGRIQDTGNSGLKTGLREIIRAFRPGIALTPNQDILLTGLDPADREPIEAILRRYAIPTPGQLANVQLYSMACPALPTCGLALAESERALPAIIDELEAELAQLGLQDERLTVRMTGCPNGCARPYVADLAFVGRSADKYVIYVGGRRDGTRLNRPYQDLVPRDELVATIRPLLVHFSQARQPGESFGDFCHRVDVVV
ncbi:MAG: NADPH-dependent assimilatory sulfite reductase hemoprotein subunit [Chloroflexi bacterium]|nr:NADPH-dependent assimilatory sulfite reductase hemoprotein subunit [Chloroflexota bacterium]MCI0579510.1 NADPH-dependent assimilatory sulfite reductase hemoprotein subunit [Chloroflexota bacterium]MCI0647278.1 NADPH-dependent assimilatory sulfite reductase hemoprotein subunit [Chloroflexota bacterium]MCI0729317.1 NADPH-dependent assimilatory sulfite reductase hemoprotein subunit [Chloroflexota bacterium]